MYETFMQTLRAFFGSGPLRLSLVVALPIVFLVIALWVVPSFRQWYGRMVERGGWRRTLVGLGAAVFKVAAILALVRLGTVALEHQSILFEHRHGRVTERNRSAVLMKWGSPHEQQELGVRFFEKRTKVTRRLKLPGEKGPIVEQTYWSDEEPELTEMDGQKPAVLGVTKEECELTVEQQPVEKADVVITVQNSPRQLGNANYAGYEDSWSMDYVVANRQDKSVTARMWLALPAEVGLFNRMELKVGSKDMLPLAKTDDDGDLTWEVPLKAGERVPVRVAYESRGLEHLRYIPRRMTQTGHYRVTMNVGGIPAKDLDWPIGSMPANEDLKTLGGGPCKLTWNLDNALTSYDIGLKLPAAPQPAYHFADLLREASWGLVLLVGLLAAPRIVTGKSVELGMVVLVLLAYYLFYTFMANLADLVPGYATAFVISVVVLGGIVIGLRLAQGGRRFLPVQDAVVFLVMVAVYPIVVISGDSEGVLMYTLYVAMLLYICVLVARRALSSRQAMAATNGG